MLRMKKTTSALLVGALCLNMFVGAAASESPTLLDISNLSIEECKVINQEINDFINDKAAIVEMKESTNTHYVQLSNGEFVKIETVMEKVPTVARGNEIINANLGDWRYGVKSSFLQGSVDIYINYHVNSTV